MKITLFLMNPIVYAGGSEKSFSELAGALSEDGHDVTIAGTSSLYRVLRSALTTIYSVVTGKGLPVRQSFYVERDLKGSTVQPIGVRELLPRSKARARFIARLRQADIIYCKNEWFDIASLRLFLPDSLMRKVVIGVHTSIFIDERAAASLWGRVRSHLYNGSFYRRQLHRCGAIHTLNLEDATAIAEHFGPDVGSKVVTIPLPLVGLGATRHQRQEGSFSLPLRLLFAQRLTHQKGLDYFADLIHSLHTSPHFQSLRFTIAGRGDSNYEELARELARTYSNVSYVGFVSTMTDLYDKHHLVVVPSRWETFSHVAIEAQAAGLPVLGFDIPGPNGIIENGRTGWLVPPGDIDALRTVVESIVLGHQSDPNLLQSMGQRGRESVEARFGKDSILGRQVSLFTRVALAATQSESATPDTMLS